MSLSCKLLSGNWDSSESKLGIIFNYFLVRSLKEWQKVGGEVRSEPASSYFDKDHSLMDHSRLYWINSEEPQRWTLCTEDLALLCKMGKIRETKIQLTLLALLFVFYPELKSFWSLSYYFNCDFLEQIIRYCRSKRSQGIPFNIKLLMKLIFAWWKI
jgi:hypothetical protein